MLMESQLTKEQARPFLLWMVNTIGLSSERKQLGLSKGALSVNLQSGQLRIYVCSHSDLFLRTFGWIKVWILSWFESM